MTTMRALLLAACCMAGSTVAHADKFKNPTAIFAGLDKITGRIISFEVAVDETVQFGSLQLTPKVCYTRPATESPQTTSFVEVDEIATGNEYRRIFTGWMFAASPGLNAVEHPVYDLWLTDCKGATDKDLIRQAPEAVEVALPEPALNARQQPPKSTDPNARSRQPNRSQTAGPILPGQPLSVETAPAPRPQPRQRFFPTDPGSAFDPANRSN